MKMIILAAGKGTRLRPLTDDKPKCMVKYQGKKIIEYILEAAKECDIKDIAIVNGYKKEVLEKFLENEKIEYFTNEHFDKTNMVNTLFCAKDFMDDDLIISYSDIIYSSNILNKLINTKKDFCVVVDKNWYSLWKKRMHNPLDDAETLKIRNNKIIEIGKKPKTIADIDSQYVGLIKITKKYIKKIVNIHFDDTIYMTDLIQYAIDKLMLEITPVYIEDSWIEIDTANDLKAGIEIN